jgi:N-acetylglucosamine-6-sulfatase
MPSSRSWTAVAAESGASLTAAHRPRVRALGFAALVLVSACGSGSAAHERDADGRPNFVFILLDDLDEVVSPYWEAMPRARALLIDRGLRFSSAFATTPVCCPARATIHTGSYPHNSGIFSGTPPDGGYSVFAKNGSEERSVSVRLQQAGYATAFIGKYLNGYEKDPELVPPGWDEWFGLAGDFLDGYTYEANHAGRMESFGADDRDYQTDVLARRALAFLDRAERDDVKPFLLSVAPSAPHLPIVPARRHQNHPYRDDPLPRRPNFDEADVSDKPLWIRDGTPHLGDRALTLETEQYRNGMGSLLAVDEMIQSIVTRLREHGEFDDTVFILSSDNGMNRGAHRLQAKTVPYEESLSVPLAVAGPGVRHGREDHFVTHLDFAPTLLDLAGVPIPDDIDGRSLVPLLEGDESTTWRTDFLVEFNGTYGFVPLHTRDEVQRFISRGEAVPYSPTYRALRTQRWLYVEWYAGPEHDYELYDMHSDPYQMSNLLATPGGAAQHAATTAELHDRLAELMSCVGVSCRT